MMRYNFAWGLNRIFADPDAAIEMLRPVMANAGANIIRLAANDPNLDSLRDDPRFQQMLASAKERVCLQPPSLVLLHPQRDFAHEADVVAVGEPFGFGRDRAQQVGQRLHFALGVIAEHVRRDPVLVAGVADADPDAAEIGAERGVDRAQAVVARRCRRRPSP